MQQYAGVEIAAARAHHEATGRGEPHRRVDRVPVAHGRHAGAVAQVGDDRAAEGRAARLLQDVLVRQAVKAVAADALVPEVARQRQAPGHLRHVAVEAGVEAGDLGHLGEAFGDDLDDVDRRRQVQRRVGHQLSEVGDQRCIDRLGRQVVGPAVHQAMSDGGGGLELARAEHVEYCGHGRAGVAGARVRVDERVAVGVSTPHRGARGADPFDGPVGQPPLAFTRCRRAGGGSVTGPAVRLGRQLVEGELERR